jgi:hypothetical protein
MAENSFNSLIGGSIIQRSFISKELSSVINVASVPVKEIVKNINEVENKDFLKSFLAGLIGIPKNSVLDEIDYKMILNAFTENGVRRYFKYLPHPFVDKYYYYWDEYLNNSIQSINFDDNDIVRMTRDFLILTTSPTNFPYANYPFLVPPSEPILFSIIRRELFKNNIYEEAIMTGMNCLTSRIGRIERTDNFINVIFDSDIPLGQSPKTNSDSLLKLLETGKKACLAPLGAGGVYGITQLTQGQYLAALLTVGTGSAMTLILIGTMAVGSLLIKKIAEGRDSNVQ